MTCSRIQAGSQEVSQPLTPDLWPAMDVNAPEGLRLPLFRRSRPMGTDTEMLLRKLDSIAELSDADRQALAALPLRIKNLRPDEHVVRDGDVPSVCCLLLDGFMHRYKVLPNGKRQILALHTPGDIPDLQSLFLRHLDHSLAALSPCKVGFIPHEDLRAVMGFSPGLA